MTERSRLARAAGLAALLTLSALAGRGEVVTVRLSTGLSAAPRISGPPRAWCPKAARPPVIDGKLQDVAWRASPVLTMGTLTGRGRPGAATEVRALRDDENLYVAFKLVEPNTARLRRNVKNPDGPVWSDDSVELFISPTGDRRYYHLGVSAGGALYDSGGKGAPAWSSHASHAVAVGDGFWAVEIAIPLGTMGVKGAPAREWRANFNRTRYAGGGSEDLAWAPTHSSSSHVPDKFGYLSFAEKDPHPHQKAAPAKAEGISVEKTTGGTVLTFDIGAFEGKRVHRARFRCERDRLTGEDPEILETIEILAVKSRQGGQVATDGKLLELAGPWYDSFDVTDAACAWASKRRATPALLVKKFPRWKPERTFLDVTFDGELAARPPAVREAKAFHRSGQTFITWRETEAPVAAKEIAYRKLKPMLDALDAKRVVRYRVYRHTRPITARTLGRAELIAEVKPLSGLNVNARCIEYGIDDKLVSDDTIITNQEDPFGAKYVTTEKGVGMDCPIRWFVIDEKAGPLAPGTGLYVHTASTKGAAYYAVTAAVDGCESGQGLAATRAVTESPAEPLPVLQGELPRRAYWRYPAKRLHYVQWCGPPKLANVPNVAFSYGVSVSENPPDDGAIPMEVHFHPRRYSYYRPLCRVRQDSLVVSPYDFPGPTAWHGYHEAAGTLRSFLAGVVRNYTEARLLSFLGWVRRRWKVHPARIVTVGGIPPGCSREDTGGTGALLFGLRHPEFVSAIMASQPVIDPSTMSEKTKGWRPHVSAVYTERLKLLGRREWKLPASGGRPAWEELDCTRLVKAWRPTARAPFVAIGGHGEQVIAFAKALRELRRGYWCKSSWGSAPLALIDGRVRCGSTLSCGIRLDRSLPAITSCSTDREKHPEVDFSSRVRWAGDGAVDEAARYEVTLSTTRGNITADVTLRRLQKFRIEAGGRYNWRLVDVKSRKELQAGVVTADADGLLTIRKYTLRQHGARLTVTPARQ